MNRKIAYLQKETVHFVQNSLSETDSKKNNFTQSF